MTKRSGFTLIELLVVIAILALMAGAAIIVYDDVQSRAELSMAQHQLGLVRDALLRFRTDMGYFPGEGPLAPAALDLAGFYYIDGMFPNKSAPETEARQRWSAHPMNLWMLFEKPKPVFSVDPYYNPLKWDWKPASGRGWRGPYLGRGAGLMLDAAGTQLTGFRGGATTNRIFAVADLIQRNAAADTHLTWVTENVPPTVDTKPVKTSQRSGGTPIAFLIDSTTMPAVPGSPGVNPVPGTIIYKLVSAGADGLFQTITPVRAGDDIMIEVTRRQYLP